MDFFSPDRSDPDGYAKSGAQLEENHPGFDHGVGPGAGCASPTGAADGGLQNGLRNSFEGHGLAESHFLTPKIPGMDLNPYFGLFFFSDMNKVHRVGADGENALKITHLHII